MKWQGIAGITGMVFGIIGLLIIATSSSPSTPAPGKPQEALPVNCFISIPNNLSFAGETVPLQDPEVFERLDKEIHVNTYFHSATIQKIKLANRWFPVIEPILKANGIPVDFKYLAVAESGLTQSVSGAGAAGFWQFLKTTGKEYGLLINDYLDERYHIEKSTEAACKYLQDAYRKFGNWTLVAASYNMGQSGLNRDMNKQGEDNYYDLLLNSETSRYVFRILALKAILENPAGFGFCYDESDLYEPLPFRLVQVDTTIPDLVRFAKDNNTNYKTLKYWNPWLRDDEVVLHTGQSISVKLPA